MTKQNTALLFSEYAPPSTCQFGVTEILAGLITPELIAGGVGEATAGVAGTALGGAAVGGAGGAALSGITGGDPLTGALGGALTGGAVGAAGGAGLGTAGQIAAGGAAGAVGSAISGSDPLQGILSGAVAGAVPGLTGGSGPSGGGTSVAPSSGAGGAGSAASAAGPAAAASVTPDLTSGAGTAGFGGGSPSGTTTTTAGGVSPATTSGSAGFGATAMSDNFTDTGGLYGSDSSGGKSSGLSGFWDKIQNNPQMLLAAAPLAMSLFSGNTTGKTQGALGAQAAEDASVGRTLTAHALSGNLPPGAQTAVDQATNAAKAKVRSSYASMGLSGSTMEAQAIQQVDQSAASQTYAMAQDLLSKGATFDQMSSQIYENLLKIQMQQDQNFSNALSSFAKALGGGTGGGGSSNG